MDAVNGAAHVGREGAIVKNAYRGGLRPLLRQLARGLKLMDETLADHAHCR